MAYGLLGSKSIDIETIVVTADTSASISLFINSISFSPLRASYIALDCSSTNENTSDENDVSSLTFLFFLPTAFD